MYVSSLLTTWPTLGFEERSCFDIVRGWGWVCRRSLWNQDEIGEREKSGLAESSLLYTHLHNSSLPAEYLQYIRLFLNRWIDWLSDWPNNEGDWLIDWITDLLIYWSYGPDRSGFSPLSTSWSAPFDASLYRVYPVCTAVCMITLSTAKPIPNIRQTYLWWYIYGYMGYIDILQWTIYQMGKLGRNLKNFSQLYLFHTRYFQRWFPWLQKASPKNKIEKSFLE